MMNPLSELPALDKHAQIVGTEREYLAEQLGKVYEKGFSVREIAAAVGRSYAFTLKVLRESGVSIRGRGFHKKRGSKSAPLGKRSENARRRREENERLAPGLIAIYDLAGSTLKSTADATKIPLSRVVEIFKQVGHPSKPKPNISRHP